MILVFLLLIYVLVLQATINNYYVVERNILTKLRMKAHDMTRFYEYYMGDKKVAFRNKRLEVCMKILREKVKKDLESKRLGCAKIDVDQAIKDRLDCTSNLIEE